MHIGFDFLKDISLTIIYCFCYVTNTLCSAMRVPELAVSQDERLEIELWSVTGIVLGLWDIIISMD